MWSDLANALHRVAKERIDDFVERSAPAHVIYLQAQLIAQPGEYKMIRRGSFRGPYEFGGYEYWSIRIDGQDGFSGSPVYDSKGDIVGVFCRYDWKQGIALISPSTHVQKLITDYNSTQPTP